ncbi:MAG: MFS transporter [Comamonadaceae bacterium]|nr:MAG: MFS transporter [Comamonadaceae bacterium]
MSRKILSAAMIGHTVESYDFVIYGYSAAALATLFFPNENRITALLSAFAVYGIAFVIRPVGAAIFGSMGDRLGRKNTLATIVLVMAFSTAAVGLLPTYASIGIAAPILLICCRLGQGISMGAEYTSAASYVMEHAPVRRRGLWMSAVTSATFLGSALAALVLLGLQLASKSAFLEWTWRVPFLLGGAMALVGLYMRVRLNETPEFAALKKSGHVAKTPIRDTFRNWRVFLLLFTVFTLLALVAQNLLGYLPTYLTETTGLTSVTVLISSSIALLFCAGLVVCAALVADRFGRRPVLVTGLSFALVTTIPAYLIVGVGTLATTVAALALLVVPVALVGISGTVIAVEMVQSHIRSTSTALSYNLAYAIFGGTAPFVGVLLTEHLGKLGPPSYITVFAALALVIVVIALPETRAHTEDEFVGRTVSEPV